MMNDNIIVRTDWYPNGIMIPLSMTVEDGSTVFFDNVSIVKSNYDNKKQKLYKCTAGSHEFCLSFCDNKWMLCQ